VSNRGIRNDDYPLSGKINSRTIGGTDSKEFTFSVFFNVNNESALEDDVALAIMGNEANGFLQIGLNTITGQIIVVADYYGVRVLEFTVSTLFTKGIPQSLAISIDMSDTAKRFVAVNGVISAATWTVFSNSLLRFTNLSYAFAGQLLGNISDIYFAPDQYLDLSVPSNLAKLITSRGYPADKGATGSLVTGTSPLVYLSRRDGEDISVFLENKGTAGQTFATTPFGAWVEDDAPIKVSV
jgi:hypothetical protein